MKTYSILNSPARIHFGFLNLDESSERIFGSLGLTISKYSYKIKIENSIHMKIECRDKSLKTKIKKIVEIISKKKKLQNFKITVLSIIPVHKGLGSGTQLCLAVGFLICKLNKIKLNVNEISIILKRGLRSGIGIESFKRGGFNIDVGKLKGSAYPPLNIMNIKWPKNWKILLLEDSNRSGLYGKKELNEFKKIKRINKTQPNLNFKSVLMNIIPGLIEKNFGQFSKGIRQIQDDMSEKFYSHPNKFASKQIEKIFSNLRKKKIISFGQSSWGPTGFVFSENEKKRNELLKYLEKYIFLNKMKGIKLLKVEGRNYGKIFTEKEKK